jgi:hypothetical protein
MCIISKFRPLTLQLLSDDKSAVYLLKTLNCAECLSEWRETKERCWCVHKCGAYGGAAPFIQMRPHYGEHVNRTCHRQYHPNNAATHLLNAALIRRTNGRSLGTCRQSDAFVDIEEH